MKRVIFVLLLLVSSHAWATPCNTPAWDPNINVMTLNNGVAHFRGLTAVIFGNDCWSDFSSAAEVNFDFGDGQTSHLEFLQNPGLIGWEFDHTYGEGNFVATVTQLLTVHFLSANFATCNSQNLSDCTYVPHGGTETLVKTFTVSHMPEPSTYAMMLAGLGLFGWVGRRRKWRAA